MSAPSEDRLDRSPTPPSVASGKAKWTVLNYSAADNNLYAYIYEDAASMEKLGSTNSVQLVTQLDHHQGGAYRFRVERDGVGAGEDRIDSPVIESLGPINMSDPKNLADFIRWGMEKFPSEKYMLVIADHGKGWEGLIQDDSHRGWMSVPQLKEALESAYQATGRKLDVIGFDACQMASVEVASEIKDYAKFMVASQALEGREGWPYSQILGQASLSDLHQAHLFKSDIEARQAVELVVRSAADHHQILPTMSAIDLSKMAELESQLKNVSLQMSQAQLAGPILREARNQAQPFGFVYDLGSFLTHTVSVARQNGKAELQQAAEQALAQLQQVVVAEHHTQEFPGASGLSVELKRPNKDYSKLQFSEATDWKIALSQMGRA
jgi:hypothetical protein